MTFFTLRVLFVAFAVSALLFITSLILAFAGFPNIVEGQMNKALSLTKDSEQYRRFKDLPFPMSFKVYIFNVSNPREILSGEKPKVKEVGPFIYKQNRHKDIKYSDCDADTITYTETQDYNFDEAESTPWFENQTITVLNPAVMALYQLAEPFYLAGVVRQCMHESEKNEFFTTTTVKDLLFNGLQFCKKSSPASLPCQLANLVLCKIAETKRNVDVLKNSEDTTIFSFLRYKIRTPDGLYTVNRGVNDISKVGRIVEWNNSKESNFWRSESQCNIITGGDGTIYPPRVTKNDRFAIYSTDICRSIEIGFLNEGSYHDIDGYRFGTKNDTLHSQYPCPGDDCYCVNQTRGTDGKQYCYLDGVVDMQPCFGVPVVLSFPHFLWADSYLKYVDGLQPNEEDHRTFVLLEPNTGIPLTGMKRIQLNAVLRPITGVKSMANTSRALLPLAWFEEGIKLTDDYISELNDMYFNKIALVNGIKWSLVSITAVLTAICGGFLIKKKFFSSHVIT